MEPQTQTQTSKDTVTMTVEIPKSARSKLGRIKGIYGCDSLACTVSSVVEDVVIPDLLRAVADREIVTNKSSQDDPIATHEPYTDIERAVLDLLKDRFESLHVKDMGELVLYMDANIIKIRNTQLPEISPAGEIPDDPAIWED